MALTLQEFRDKTNSSLTEGDLGDLPMHPGSQKTAYPPPFLTMRRKAVRSFPDGRHVALYYIAQLDKYVSIPFDTGNAAKNDLSAMTSEEIAEELDDLDESEDLDEDYDTVSSSSRHPDETHPHAVVDMHTKRVVSKHQTSSQARRAVDKRDNAYGAYRFKHHPTKLFGPYKPAVSEEVEVLDEAAKKAKKAKKKEKPYDFFNHLKDVAKGGELKNSPLRFESGERHRCTPEVAELLLHAHKHLNPLNQVKMKKMLRTSKDKFHKVSAFALGKATVS